MKVRPAEAPALPPALLPLADSIQYPAAQRAPIVVLDDHGTPSVFLGYQGKWVLDKAQVKIIEKSRRVGLSWGEAEDSVECAAAAGGMDVWYIGYTKDMAIEFILDCAQWARQMAGFVADVEVGEEIFQDGDDRQAILKFSITFASGNRITALSSAPRNLRGKQGRVIIDEAAFHTDLAGLIKAAMALLIWGGEVHIISTHNGDDNPFNVMIKDIRAGRLPYSLHRVTFDDALRDGLYRRVCMRNGKEWTAEGEAKWAADIRAQYGDDAEEELDCVPKSGTGSFLTTDLIERAMRKGWPVLRDQRKPSFTFEPEHVRQLRMRDWCEEFLRPELETLRGVPGLTSYVGGDFGRIRDLSAFAPLVVDRTMRRRMPFFVELRGMPFQQQREVLWYLINGLPRFVGAALDSRGLGMQMAEETAQRYGPTRILMIQATQGWYLENLPPFKAAFEDGLIEMPMDADVMADYRIPRVIKGIPQIPDLRTVDAEKRKRHGDTFIAGAMAHHAMRNLQGTADYEYQPVPNRASRWDGPREDDDFRHQGDGAW